MEAIIDFGKTENFTSVSISVWKQEASWIYLPSSVEIFISADGKDWNTVAKALPENGIWKDEHSISLNFSVQSAKYIKVIAHNYGKIADGKAGSGNNAWLFVDEIKVN